jgi:hypothetical protein
MTMTSRSTRDTSLAHTTTSNLAGPGRYTLRKEKVVKPKYTAFSNSEERPDAGVENADAKFGRVSGLGVGWGGP